ncbi:MAG: trimethylamine methyltransferase family protein [Spirochaetaceae bacterium]|nr:MAG: trimethylamine methyltransferase family protein [Spirochaetaceae bacterium]
MIQPRLSFFEPSQCEQIHQAALEILRRTGVRVFHEEALRLLAEADCLVQEENWVRIPPALVEWALQQPPSRVTLCRRGSDEISASLQERRVNFGPGSDCPNFLDPRTGEHRLFTLEDVQAVLQLADSLPELSFLMSTGIPSDHPAHTYRRQFATLIQNCVKPVVFVCDDGEDCRRIIAAAAAIAGGEESLRLNPTLLLYSEPTTPLQHSQTALEKLLVMAETGIPVVHSPAPMMGGTAPITLAGGLALSTAEVLSGLVIHQLKASGAPFVYGSGLHHLDMRTSISVYGAPEFQLARLGVADMGRFYGLPTWGYAGHTDSCLFDEQAAADAVFSTLVALQSGTNLVHDVGYMEAGLTNSPEMIVFTCEMIGMLRHFQGGFAIDEENLALEVIDQVGPGGNFLSENHTMEHFREYWQPTLFSRQRYDTWKAEEAKPLGQRLRERTVALMDQASGTPLPDSQAEEVEYILGLRDKKA